MRAIIIGLILVLMISGCSTASKSIIEPAKQFAMTINQKQQFGDVVITLKEINESRCPTGGNCIRIGEAIAVLNLVIDNKSERNIQLCTGGDCRSRAVSGDYTLNTDSQKYLFKLDSIAPYPNLQKPNPEKKVYFSVEYVR